MTCDIRDLNPYKSPEERMLEDIEREERNGCCGSDTIQPLPIKISYDPIFSYLCPVCGRVDEVVPIKVGKFRCDRCHIIFDIKTFESGEKDGNQ